MPQGLVIKLIGGQYTVMDQSTNEEVVCVGRGKLRHMTLDKNSSFLKQKTLRTKIDKQTIKLSPKVGDLCTYTNVEGVNQIIDLKPRKNELERPDVVNVDQVLLVFAATKPTFSFALLDRLLVLLDQADIHPVLIVTKIDLVDASTLETLKSQLAYYEEVCYMPVYYLDNKAKKGFDEIQTLFKGKISILSGQTGAGKSTFLNSLIPGFQLQTQEISKALGRGKHTTRHTELYHYSGGMIADTPGFSKLDFGQMSPEELAIHFSEFFAMSSDCKFRAKCLHLSEPGCAVLQAIENDRILPSRYENYKYFHEEIKQTKPKY